MKICRIIKYLPGASDRPGVLQAYFLTRYIAEPTLIITKRKPGSDFPLPRHARVQEVAYGDVAFTSRLEPGFLDERASLRARLRFIARLVLKLRESTLAVKALRHLVAFRPDIVHCHGLATVLPGLVARAGVGSRLVVSLHNVTEAVLVRRLWPVRRALGHADRVICVSDAIRREIAPYLPSERLDVIPTAMDPTIFRDLGLPRKKQLIAVGYFKWQKGYEDLLHAAADVFARYPDHRLVIIGDGAERPRIEAVVRQLGLGEHVQLLGLRPQLEIARHLNESRLFVMSSLVEGLPKALLEAVACGTPAVVTTACNAEDLIDRVGLAVEPRDPAALAKAIIELLGDEPRRQALARSCAAVAEEYTWKRVAERVHALYRGLDARR